MTPTIPPDVLAERRRILRLLDRHILGWSGAPPESDTSIEAVLDSLVYLREQIEDGTIPKQADHSGG